MGQANPAHRTNCVPVGARCRCVCRKCRGTLSCEEGIPPCPWDFNGNGEVDFQDLLKILANWGPCPGT